MLRKVAFNEEWLVVMTQETLHIYHLASEAQFKYRSPGLIFNRRRRYISFGLHGNIIWAAELEKNKILLSRFRLSADGNHKRIQFISDPVAQSDFNMSLFSPDVIFVESNDNRRVCWIYRPVHEDLIAIPVPHLASYAVIDETASPVPVLHQARRIGIVDSSTAFSRVIEVPDTLLDAVVDGYSLYCLMPKSVGVIDLRQGRLLNLIDLPSSMHDSTRIWGAKSSIAIAKENVCLFLDPWGNKAGDIEGRLIISNAGAPVVSPKAVVMFWQGKVEQLRMIEPDARLFGLFDGRSQMLSLSL